MRYLLLVGGALAIGLSIWAINFGMPHAEDIRLTIQLSVILMGIGAATIDIVNAIKSTKEK